MRRAARYAAGVKRARPRYGVQTASELHAFAIAMLRARLRREHPRWSEAAIDAEVKRWQLARPGAEHGDAEGRVVPWPRPRRRA